MARHLGAITVALVVGAGCASDFGTLGNPQISFCAGPTGVPCVRLQAGTSVQAIPLPRNPGESSFFEIFLENLGEEPTDVLNIFLAEGTNSYVQLLWAESDPTGDGKYQSNSPVLWCTPDPSQVAGNTPLPSAASPAQPNCVFPMELRGLNENKQPGARRLRLQYDYSPELTPDERPVRLAFHFSYQEDASAPGGVRILEIPVQQCTGRAEVAPVAIKFSATPPNIETQQICIQNQGCADLEIKNISFANPVAGDIFTFLDQPPPGTKLASLNDAEGKSNEACFTLRFKPVDSNVVSNVVRIETSDPVQPNWDVVLSTGQDCPYSYELQHQDEVESGKPYIDFTGVVSPQSATRIISLRNTNSCPITLDSAQFKSTKDLKTQGGPFYIEYRKGGQTVGWLGVPAGPGISINPKVVLGKKDDAMDLVVYFEPDDGVVYSPTELSLRLRTGTNIQFDETFLIQAGEATAELALVPGAGTPLISALYFSADQGATATRTFALANRGLAPMTVTGLKLGGNGQADYELVDDGQFVVGGQFVSTQLEGLGVVPVTVKFTPKTGAFDSKARIDVHTEEFPEGGGKATPYQVVLQGYGYYPPNAAPALPLASFGDAEQFADVRAGEIVTLSGSESSGGANAIVPQSYTFWLSQKPAGSAAFLDSQGKETVTFKFDMAGLYRLHLTVFSQAPAGAGGPNYLYSDEAVVEVNVTE